MQTEGGILRPIDYVIEIEIGRVIGNQGTGSIALTDRPFVFQEIRHMIIRDGRVDKPVQDGLYRIDWSLYETTRFFKGAVPFADVEFGSIRTGIWIPLKAPISIEGNQTINVAVQNEWLRPADFAVQVIFSGVERIDTEKAG
jgi:hypothetical protein